MPPWMSVKKLPPSGDSYDRRDRARRRRAAAVHEMELELLELPV